MNDSNLKASILELRNVFALYLPAEDVAGVLRKSVDRALAEVLGNAPKRRGRPPKNAAASSAPTAPAAAKATGKKKKGRSPASRAKQAAKMRAYWAARKASEGGSKAAPKKKRGRPAKAKVADAPVV